MAIRSACLVLALAYLQVAASVSDESCLVQSQKDVLFHRQEALSPNVKMMEELVHLDPPPIVVTFARQLQIPTDMPNVSAEDMMALGLEALALFRNETAVNSLYAGLFSVVQGLVTYSESLLQGTQNLSLVAANASSRAEVLTLLKDFFVIRSEEIADMTAKALLNPGNFIRHLPDGKLKDMLEPAEKATGWLKHDDVAWAILHNTLLPAVSNLTHDEAAFCVKFRPLQGNISQSALFLANDAPVQLRHAEAALPQIKLMVEASTAADVSDEFMKFANATLQAMGTVTASFQKSTPVVDSVLTELAEKGMGCAPAADAPSDHSAAALRAAWRLGSAAVAAALWVLAA